MQSERLGDNISARCLRGAAISDTGNNPTAAANNEPPAEEQRDVAAANHAPINNIRRWWQIGWDRAVELGFTFAILAATIVNVCVANRQWSAMLESNTISRNNAEQSLRAYVGINNEDTVVNCAACDDPIKQSIPERGFVDDNMRIFTVENYGQTPAFDGHGTIGTKDMPLGRDLPSNFDYPLGDANTRTPIKVLPWVLEPHDKNHFGAAMDASQIDLIKRARLHQITLYIYGQVTYLDAFDCNATMIFCFRDRFDKGSGTRLPLVIDAPCPALGADCVGIVELLFFTRQAVARGAGATV